MIKLNARMQSMLLNYPETGMGYQIVDATFSDHRHRECLVLNATIAEPVSNGHFQEAFRGMFSEDLNRIYKYASSSNEIIDVKISNKQLFVRAFKLNESVGAQDAVDDKTKLGEKFIRFSAFEDDRRVDKISKFLLPGSYATTYEDGRYCLASGIDPVSRYALPNPEKVKYAFHIAPFSDTRVKRGTVQPANGQHGGGVEVLFPEGTNPYSVELPPQVL